MCGNSKKTGASLTDFFCMFNLHEHGHDNDIPSYFLISKLQNSVNLKPEIIYVESRILFKIKDTKGS